MRFCFICFFLFIGLASTVKAQPSSSDSQNQLALMYFTRGEYARAADIYKDLYQQSRSHVHFVNLLECYQQLKDFDSAEEIIETQIKHYPNNVFYSVSLLQIYVQTNRSREAASLHRRIQRQSLRDKQRTIDAVSAYVSLNLLDMAQSFINEAKKQFPESTEITKTLIDLYRNTRDYSNLVQEAVNLVVQDSYELEYVESQLQLIVFDSHEKDRLVSELHTYIQKQLQKQPDNVAINELLIWVYIQEKKLQPALMLSRALDTRLKENGERVFNLGKIAQSNEQYIIAKEAFSYVLQKGATNSYYVPALKALLQTANTELFASDTIEKKQLLALEHKYLEALKNLGKTNQTVDVVRALAHLQAFYLHKTSQAKELLEQVLEIPRIGILDKALCELELANILVFEGDVWMANLLYAKIALNHRNNDVGHKARFKQAKLAYYNAQFSYAQALLDVIKAGSSKLIANNALELSQLIANNTVHDPQSKVLTVFAYADLLMFQKKYAEAIDTLTFLEVHNPTHSIIPYVFMKKADLVKINGDSNSYVQYLNRVIQEHPHAIPVHKAHYKLARYYDSEGNDVELAKQHYLEIVMNHPTSYYIHESRKRYRELLIQ